MISPKIEFFLSVGLSENEVRSLFVRVPNLFWRSLEKQIMPTFNYVKSLFDLNETDIEPMKRHPHVLFCDFESQLRPNVETLREAGVNNKRFREVVVQVKELGFKRLEFKFVLAVHALRSMTKSTWDSKLSIYKEWGWSEDEIISAFVKEPHSMVVSADKIKKVRDLLVNRMGFDSSIVLRRPDILSCSFEKRMKPRSLVYMALLEKGLIKRDTNIVSVFKCNESDFLKKFVHCYEEANPGLLKVYQKELAAATISDDVNPKPDRSFTGPCSTQLICRRATMKTSFDLQEDGGDDGDGLRFAEGRRQCFLFGEGATTTTL
ncbi:hypothetical protein BUALT_Bualt14G0071800 [Buddleja alternifolia]|uniref:Uncharacterized protein n=1 Tax=Buddleja alternifolia TaxID=168488 RepID=A0AAV6WP06_9LAMI|nr:hypothetical protein BUALT_Bualt14G0071800 [Buddleja alternifolia]